jgi:putative hemolysin
MPDLRSSSPLPIAPLFPPALRPWMAPLSPAIERWFLPDELAETLRRAEASGPGATFARQLLESLDIAFSVDPGDKEHIPATGPAIVVANHPYGVAEGMILMALLDSIRKDFKVLVNSLLSSLPALHSNTILVNPFDTAAAAAQNLGPMRESMQWLRGGGLLATFPAGEVAHLNWEEHAVTDPAWKTTAARLALRLQCPVVPVFFEGANSLPFQLAGVLHPRLRTVNLPRELLKMRHRTVRVRIGNPIPFSLLKHYQDPDLATDYLRSRTFFLSHRSGAGARPSSVEGDKPTTASQSPASQKILGELAALPADRELVSSSEFSVYLAGAGEIPRLMHEIGRCRELAFRAAGEGTGREVDLDRFDQHYQHLILWSKSGRLAGAYRLGVTTDLLPRFGAKGLYTNTLFKFKRGFFDRLGPAVELGRSFICLEYQRNYASLLMLWKGIARFVQRRPEAAVLFGAVSISREYCEASRGLIATYLADRESHELASMVQPRSKFRGVERNPSIRRLAELTANIEDLSYLIADIENDKKGVPLLIRQYLKTGGKLLGFNVDPNFSDVLDALLLADLRVTEPGMLERCMGRAEARAFREWHAARGPSPPQKLR